MFFKAKYLLSLLSFCSLLSCKKFLDETPDKRLVVPSTLIDLQALLDNNTVMNNYSRGLAEACADDYYLTAADWAALSSDGDKQAYIWGDEFVFDQYPNEWANYYRTVYAANTALERIETIPRTGSNSIDWDNVKGSALFYRAFSFHNVAITWAKGYDSSTALTDLGIPLRLNTDFNEVSKRASLKETYERIIADLKEAVPLLPQLAKHVMRPSRTAAYALLGRVHLSLRNYAEAGSNADSSLRLRNTLIDYNTVSAAANFPLLQFNAEVLFHCSGAPSLLSNTRAKIDSTLYASYSSLDLRKTVFFKNNNNGTFGFKGNYSGTSSQFFGLATNEVYMMKAECLARSGQYTEAMTTLNALLLKRWKAGSFIPLTATGSAMALNLILTERRKELLMRNLRWMDVKRRNKEGANLILRRNLNGQQYILLPNAEKYALPLPGYVINASGMPQNPK